MENRPDIHQYFQKIADRLSGMAMEYTNEMGIISLKLLEGRSQNVRGFFKQKGEHWMLMLSSKVCSLDEYQHVDFKDLTLQNNKLWEAKAVIHHDYLEIASVTMFSELHFEHACNLVLEVAHTADELEHQITGLDVH